MASISAGTVKLIVIIVVDIVGNYSLMDISSDMSLMFPTINGVVPENVGDGIAFGTAGLVTAINRNIL